MVDALAQRGDEGRSYRRYSSASRKHALTRGFPNGVTLSQSCGIIPKGRQTRRSETSQYPEEKKSNEIPLVEAIEKGEAQTRTLCPGVVGLPQRL